MSSPSRTPGGRRARRRRARRAVVLGLSLLVLAPAACGGGSGPSPAGADAADAADPGPADVGPPDVGPADVGDAGPADVGDAGPAHVGDAGPADAADAGAEVEDDALAPGDAGAEVEDDAAEVEDGGAGDGGPAGDALLDAGAGDAADAGPTEEIGADDAEDTDDADDAGDADDADDAGDADADTSPPPAPPGLLITEILASNQDGISDEDGDESDWIELHNPTADPVSLLGWRLTDDLADLDGWTFPDVVLPPRGYLLVWASGKDRAVAGEPLHTSFKLAAGGESVALLDPWGQVVHALEGYPPQLPDVAWGLPTTATTQPLVVPGASVWWAPVEPDEEGTDWRAPGFDPAAAGWTPGTTGLGFELEVPPKPPTVVADSVVGFSGGQGQDGWWYGWWDASADVDGAYDPWTDLALFPWSCGSWGPTCYWSGSSWDWFEGNPPWTQLTASGGHPNGASHGGVHVPVRRWVSDVAGPVRLSGTLKHGSSSGDGVVGRLLVDGEEVWAAAVQDGGVPYEVDAEVEVGSWVEALLDPGPAGDDGSDSTVFTLLARAGDFEAEPPPPVGEALADSAADWSVTGEQGAGGWWYGYWDRSADADGVYEAADFTPFPRDGGGWSATDAWNGSGWDWYEGNPPWTSLGKTGVHPNSVANGGEHWPIRRWVSPVAGTLRVEWRLRKSNPKGGGVTGHVLHDGVEVDFEAIAGDDTEGVVRTVWVTGVEVGDPIDLAVDPWGPTGDPSDGNDGSVHSARVWAWPDLAALVATDVSAAAAGAAPGVRLRATFEVPDPAAVNRLVLRMRYEDGFVAWLNGQPLAAEGAPEEPTWDAWATGERADAEAVEAVAWDLRGAVDLLVPGTNVLAVQGLRAGPEDADLLVLPELDGRSVAYGGEVPRWFPEPTPGEDNDAGVTHIGPRILAPSKDLALPPGADQVVTALVVPTEAPVAEVRLLWRAMFGEEQELPMTDDGAGADGLAGDGLYAAALPTAALAPGTMVRWAVVATDAAGAATRSPPWADPVDRERYHGGVVGAAEDEAPGGLPTLRWFVDELKAAGSPGGTTTALWFRGELYDNVAASLHGQSTKGFPKKSYNLDLPRDHRLRLVPELRRVKDLKLLTNYADKSKLRNTLAYEVYRDAGADHHLAFPARVVLNGSFWAVYDVVEDGDDRWLERLGHDPEGALYKLYDGLESVDAAEKKTRKGEGREDLQALIDATALTGEAQTAFVYDALDVPATVNMLAAMIVTAGRDCCHKNYYLYRDTRGTGEWRPMPWDVDLTFGRNFSKANGGYFDDTLHPDNGLWVGSNNALFGMLFGREDFRAMYLRRVRTLMDALVQPPGTPPEALKLETRVDALAALLGEDAWLDDAVWPTWGTPQDPAEAVAALKDDFLAPRRAFLYEVLSDPLPADAPVLVEGAAGATLARWRVPVDDALGEAWAAPGFDDAAWTLSPLGLGYEASPGPYAAFLATKVTPAFADPAATGVQARVRFEVADPGALDALTLRVRHDDGFVAWLNGVEVARAGLEGEGAPAWDAVATANGDSAAMLWAHHDLAPALGLLVAGENVLAVQVVNAGAGSSDLLLAVELVAAEIAAGGGPLPGPPGPPQVAFGAVDASPASGDPAEQLVQLVNLGGEAVDLSGWTLAGDVALTVRPGTVLPAGAALYLAADVPAFRARAEGPSGGQGLFVQGPWEGALASPPGELTLRNAAGGVVATW